MTSAASKSKYICLAAGGTGGHVMPAICIAETLLADGHRILLLTDKRGARLIPAHIPHKILASASPFAGSAIKRILAFGQLTGGFAACLFMLATKRPSVLLGFGGYPAAAPICAAWCLGIPAVMHEQNAVIGRTNLMLARFTKTLFTSWPDNDRLPASTPIYQTGLPVRDSFTRIAPYKAPAKKNSSIRLAIFGGSLGAALFAEIIPAALALLPVSLRRRLAVTQQVREEQKIALDAFYKEHEIAAETKTFFENVADVMAEADLVISRAGASSVAEIACAGRAAIFIPFARALDNHQQANARQLCAHKGGILLSEADLSAQSLSEKLAELIKDDKMRQQLAASARRYARPDSARQIADYLVSCGTHQNKEAA